MKKELIRLGGILFLIAFFVSLILAFGNMITKDKIAENNQNKEQAAKQEVMPDGKEFNALTEAVPYIYEAKDASGNVVGYCVNTESDGFGGTISLMVGVKTDGTVSGVNILSFSETAGLGAKAGNEDFRNQYAGKTAGIEVTKSAPSGNEIQAISGATITSKAVTKGVNEAIDVLTAQGYLK